MQKIMGWIGVAGRDPREQSRALLLALGVPLLAIVIFLGLW